MAKKNVPYDQEYYDKEIETMPREQLEELQLGYLKDELKFAYENCPYYKRAWDEAGVSPEIDSLADLQKFPFINKQTAVSYTHLLRPGQGARGVLPRAQAGWSAHLRDDRLRRHA